MKKYEIIKWLKDNGINELASYTKNFKVQKVENIKSLHNAIRYNFFKKNRAYYNSLKFHYHYNDKEIARYLYCEFLNDLYLQANFIDDKNNLCCDVLYKNNPIDFIRISKDDLK